jgi:hypothetical protein
MRGVWVELMGVVSKSAGRKAKPSILREYEKEYKGIRRDLKNLGRLTNRLLTGSLSVKDMTVYRGQSVKPDPELRGGDFKRRWDKVPLGRQLSLHKLSGKFWSGDQRVATHYVPVKTPAVVLKGDAKKTDALRGLRGVFKQDRLLTGETPNQLKHLHSEHEAEKRQWRRTRISTQKRDIKYDARLQLVSGRKHKIYETVLEPDKIKNRRVDLGATYKVNPTFKGVRTQAIKTGLRNLSTAGSRLLAPVAAGMFVHDVVKHGPLKAVQNLSPVPAYNPDHGYRGDTDPRKRKRKTIQSIRD